MMSWLAWGKQAVAVTLAPVLKRLLEEPGIAAIVESMRRGELLLVWSHLRLALDHLTRHENLEGIEIRPDGSMVRVNAVVRSLGGKLLLELRIRPVELVIGETVQLGIQLVEVGLGGHRGLYDAVVAWFVRMFLRHKFGGLRETIELSIGKVYPVRTVEDTMWIDFSGDARLQRMREVVAGWPGGTAAHLGLLVQCSDLEVTEQGLLIKLKPGVIGEGLIAIRGKMEGGW